MDVWRITVVALRRWYVLLPLLALTAVLVMVSGRGVKEEVDVSGATMLVPGRVYSEDPNPYGGPSDANNAVAIVLNSPEVRSQIAEKGLIPSYEVSPQTRSTVMNFQVRGDSAETAVETGIAVFQQAAIELRDRQTAAGVPAESQYTIDVLQTPSVSAVVTDGKVRNMAVVGVLGAALSLVITVFFDDVVGLLRRRRRRRTSDAAAGSAAQSAPGEGGRTERTGDVEPSAADKADASPTARSGGASTSERTPAASDAR